MMYFTLDVGLSGTDSPHPSEILRYWDHLFIVLPEDKAEKILSSGYMEGGGTRKLKFVINENLEEFFETIKDVVDVKAVLERPEWARYVEIIVTPYDPSPKGFVIW